MTGPRFGFGSIDSYKLIKELMHYLDDAEWTEGVYLLVSKKEDGTFTGTMGHNRTPYSKGGTNLDYLYETFVYQSFDTTAREKK